MERYRPSMIAPSKAVARIAASWVARRGARSVLDVGCGSGSFVRGLRRRGVAAFGVDVRPVLVQGDAEALPFPNRRFDAVTVLLVLHYVRRPARALREAARVLRPGGWIIVADRLASPDPAHERIERLRNPAFHGFLTLRGMERALAGAGLAVDHREDVEGRVTLDEWLAGVPKAKARRIRNQAPRDVGTLALEGPNVRLRMKLWVARKIARKVK